MKSIEKHCLKGIALVILYLIFPSANSFAQILNQNFYDDHDTVIPFGTKNTYAFNLSGVGTGSSFGMSLNPSLCYKHKKHLLAFGPNIQRDHFNISGLQTYYQKDFAASINNLVLYYHLNLIYHFGAFLGPSAMERHMNIYGSRTDFRFNTFEHYAGFGARKVMSDQIYLDTSIGLGAYYTMNGGQQELRVPFRADNDFSLMLKIGLTYDLRK
jgi:hypothetical protein